MHVEKTFFDLADSCPNNCIVICDRGVMDATACTLLRATLFYLLCTSFCRVRVMTDMLVLFISVTSMQRALFFLYCYEDMSPEQWQRMKTECDWNEVDLRDNRYHLVVHLVSAANGAEAFYTTQGHATRHEGIEFAKTLDKITSQVCICSVFNTSSPPTTCVCVHL